jgi:UDP-N-acetylmuramate--alanine ligase
VIPQPSAHVPDMDAVRSAHLVGIGGTAMTPLATILLQKGVQVSGSDLGEPPWMDTLRGFGARVALGHQASNLGPVDVVVTSSAIPEGNPEVIAARARGIPVIKHSAALGSLLHHRRGIAIAGTHGKTTTSALVATVLDSAGLDPTFHVGSELLGYGLFGRLGRGDLLVAEADEYDRRFLEYDPEVAVVTSLEPDHLDYFGTFDAVIQAFHQFLDQVRPGGLVILCADDPGASSLRARVERTSYGFSQDADWQILEWHAASKSTSRFTVRQPSGELHQYELQLRGRHNAQNAAAAVVVASHLGVEHEQIEAGLRAFRGTRRRFEVICESNGVTVVDDYAHHPTAIQVNLQAAREHYRGGIWVVFQPHTAHRTTSLMDQFATCFAAADHVVITPTYRPAGRETEGDDPSITELMARIEHPDTRLLPADDAAEYVGRHAQPGDLVLVMGAGDIWQVEQPMCDLLAAR